MILLVNGEPHGGERVKDFDAFTYLGVKVCKEGGGMKGLKNT